MADTKISSLTAITGANIATNDLVPVIDVSAGTSGSKQATIAEFLTSRDITGGTIAGLTGFGLRDTVAAFDLSIVATGTGMSAARTLTLDCGNVAHTLALGTTAGTITFPNAAVVTVAGLQIANVFTAAQTISTAGAASFSPLLMSGVIMTGGTGTTNFPNLLIQPTGATAATNWSTSGTAIGVNLDVDAGNLLDLKVDGISRIRGNQAGQFFLGSPVSAGAGNGITMYGTSGTRILLIENADGTNLRFWLNSVSPIAWSATADLGTMDTMLYRDGAAGTLAMRHNTDAPQTFRVYGTADDHPTVTNYVRASLAAASTTVTLAAETAGTGADNVPINITTAGTGLVDFTNQAASVDAAVVSTHSARMKFGGVEYKIMLATP